MDFNLIRLGASEFEATDGRTGKPGFLHKRSPPDLLIKVPLGTAVYSIDKEANKKLFLEEILIKD